MEAGLCSSRTYVFFSQHLGCARHLILGRYLRVSTSQLGGMRVLGGVATGVRGHVRIMSEIMEVPLPRAASRRLISFFTFHISIYNAREAC